MTPRVGPCNHGAVVQVVENWAQVEGVVRGRERSPVGTALVSVILAVSRVDDVEGFPNLLHEAVGRDLGVLMPAAAADRAELRDGACARCRVRKASPALHFADPGTVERVPDEGPTP